MKKFLSLFVIGLFTFTTSAWAWPWSRQTCTEGMTWDANQKTCVAADIDVAAAANTTNTLGNNNTQSLNANGSIRTNDQVQAGTTTNNNPVTAPQVVANGLPGTNTVVGPVTPADSPNDTTPSAAAGNSTLGSPGEPGKTTLNSTVPNMQVYGTNGSVLTGSRPAVSNTAGGSVTGTANIGSNPNTQIDPSMNTTITTNHNTGATTNTTAFGASRSIPTSTGASANTMGATTPSAGTLTTSNTGANSSAGSSTSGMA